MMPPLWLLALIIWVASGGDGGLDTNHGLPKEKRSVEGDCLYEVCDRDTQFCNQHSECEPCEDDVCNPGIRSHAELMNCKSYCPEYFRRNWHPNRTTAAVATTTSSRGRLASPPERNTDLIPGATVGGAIIAVTVFLIFAFGIGLYVHVHKKRAARQAGDKAIRHHQTDTDPDQQEADEVHPQASIQAANRKSGSAASDLHLGAPTRQAATLLGQATGLCKQETNPRSTRRLVVNGHSRAHVQNHEYEDPDDTVVKELESVV